MHSYSRQSPRATSALISGGKGVLSIFQSMPSAKKILRNTAYNNLLHNFDTGKQYTGFKDLCSILPKKFIMETGIVYDLYDTKDCGHILKFLKDLKKESPREITMTCGSFFSKNSDMQKKVSRCLNSLAQHSKVTIYVGGDDVKQFFQDAVNVITYNRNEYHIPHFIKSPKRFLIELPHTEKKQVRVDIASDKLESDKTQAVLVYLDNLVKKLK